MSAEHATATPDRLRRKWWRIACIVLAIAYAAPVIYVAESRLTEVTRRAREHLIVQYRLWEMHPEYAGTPQMWTRVAAWVLSDNQLLRRVRARHGAELAKEIELDYRRDLTLAQLEVVLAAVAAWALPPAGLYGLGLLLVRQRQRRLPEPAPPALPDQDSRYRP